MDPWASRNGLALLRKLLGNRNNEVLKFGCEINPDWLVARLAWVCIRLDVHREFTAGLREDLRGGTTRRLDRKAVAAPPSAQVEEDRPAVVEARVRSEDIPEYFAQERLRIGR